MAIREILVAPNRALRQSSVPVTDIGSVHELINDMLDTMYSAPNGIGLAAPQVGRPEAVVVVDISADHSDPIVLVNPAIISAHGAASYKEGCLSVPNYFAEVVRPSEISVSALNRNGDPITLSATGILAVVLQHEIDHLDGILFIDKLKPIKRHLISRKLYRRSLQVQQ